MENKLTAHGGARGGGGGFIEEGDWEEDKRVLIDNLLTSSENPRIINYKLYKYPVEDPVDMWGQCEETGKKLKLKSYRYPAYYDQQYEDQELAGKTASKQSKAKQQPQKPKGVVFFSHGWSDYTGRQAHVAQLISRMGYDFFTMDYRGHGKSEGEIGVVPSIDIIANDTIAFHTKVIEQYYSLHEQPKVYWMAHSMGCMQLMNILMRPHMVGSDSGGGGTRIGDVNDGFEEMTSATVSRPLSPINYTACSLICPFFDFVQYEKDRMAACCGGVHLFLRCHYWVKGRAAQTPKYDLDLETIPEHLVHWRVDFDNPFQKRTVPLHTLFEFEKEVRVHQQICDWHYVRPIEKKKKKSRLSRMSLRSSVVSTRLTENYYAKIDIPIQMIIGDLDGVVCNQRSKQIHGLLKQGGGKEKEKRYRYEQFKNLDHAPFADGLLINQIFERIEEWFQKW